MRLLLFIPSLMGGGAERVAANLANHWAARGWAVTIATLAARATDAYELDARVERISLGLDDERRGPLRDVGKNVARVHALRRVLQHVAPDVALSLTSVANVILALAKSGLRVCAIGSEHTHPPCAPLGLLREALRRATYGRLAAVVALTAESAQWLQTSTSARTVPVIPNPVAWPLPSRAHAIAPVASRSHERRLLLTVGRLSAEKNLPALFAAFARVAQRHDDWDVVVLGEGPDRAALAAEIDALGLRGRVALPGRVAD
ncbi:MAG TPA: glycosyltransferase, partial [Nannocystaceae bacterium]|nr:glycosyltransferase [Nannocystaceae bacterium]